MSHSSPIRELSGFRNVSRLRHFVRLSFGPSIESVTMGLARLKELIEAQR